MKIKGPENVDFIYSKKWRWGWFVIYMGFLLYDAFVLTGIWQIAMVALMAFLAGFQLEFAISTHSWRKIAKGWQELYEKSNAWRYN